MGTLATESYIRLVNRETHAHSDQEFLDYVVFNDAAVPDRTAFIIGQSDDDPFPIIADDIDKATAMGASFIVLTCNTAHYFYDHFQSLTPVPILHMPRGAVAHMAGQYPKERITSLIYDDVKGTGDLNLQRYESVLQAMLDPAGTCRCDTLMLGCTELSVLNEAFPLPQLPIIDAQAVLVEDTVSRAKAIRR